MRTFGRNYAIDKFLPLSLQLPFCRKHRGRAGSLTLAPAFHLALERVEHFAQLGNLRP